MNRRSLTEPESPRPSNHKDTRKWCKGKVGTKHNYLPHVYFASLKHTALIEKCSNCGRLSFTHFRVTKNQEKAD